MLNVQFKEFYVGVFAAISIMALTSTIFLSVLFYADYRASSMKKTIVVDFGVDKVLTKDFYNIACSAIFPAETKELEACKNDFKEEKK